MFGRIGQSARTVQPGGSAAVRSHARVAGPPRAGPFLGRYRERDSGLLAAQRCRPLRRLLCPSARASYSGLGRGQSVALPSGPRTETRQRAILSEGAPAHSGKFRAR